MTTFSERTVFEIAQEYSRRLGIPCPEIVTQRSKALTTADWHRRDSRVFGRSYGGDHLSINRTNHRGSLAGLKNTIAHEFIHHAFPNLPHGPNFERHIQALQSGNMFFRGSIRRPNQVVEAKKVGWGDYDGLVYRYGNVYWKDRPMQKVVVLDTDMPKEPVSVEEKVAKAQAAIKRLDTKIKRLTTAKKKWERKLKRLEKS